MTQEQKTHQVSFSVREYPDGFRFGYGDDVIVNADILDAYIQSEVSKQLTEAQQNGVAWAIGVIDELHINDGLSPVKIDTDKVYKEIKNTIRDEYEAITGIDPAPKYPVNAKLKEQQ